MAQIVRAREMARAAWVRVAWGARSGGVFMDEGWGSGVRLSRQEEGGGGSDLQ